MGQYWAAVPTDYFLGCLLEFRSRAEDQSSVPWYNYLN
jgi:hypothetical protein